MWRVRLVAATALAACGMAAAQTPGAAAYGDPIQFFAAAGFKVAGKQPTNWCGQPAQPRVTLVDINGDGQKNEALFIDAGPCYKPDNVAFAIVARDGPGKPWRQLVAHSGTIKAMPQRTDGWFDMTMTTAGKSSTLRYVNGSYAEMSAETPPPPTATPAPVKAAGPATAAGAPLPAKAAQLTPAQRNVLMLAAGYKRVGTKWKGCDGTSDAALDDSAIEGGAIRDLNGDGRVEVITTDGGLACYGNTGQGYVILSQDAAGKWASIDGGPGIPNIQTTRAPNGWLDIEIGGPGFCFAVQRWTGKAYQVHHFNEYMKGICAQNGLKPAVRKY